MDRILGQGRHVPYSYKQFLLEETTESGPRVIVDSGSNAFHSINPWLLSAYFNGPAIITADNAGVPLRNRWYNLLAYARAGDVIILPLEWHYYSSTTNVNDYFTNRIANKDRHWQIYYSALPLLERIRFIFRKFPLRAAIKSLVVRPDERQSIASDLQRLDHFKEILTHDDFTPLGGVNRNGPEKPINDLSIQSCDQRLFSTNQVSHEFASLLPLLAQIRNTGVRIYFTWPAVVDHRDSPCYQEPLKQTAFATQIKGKLEQAGFPILGQYRDFKYGKDCFLDTVYHIKTRCADSHTNGLIEELRAASVAPFPSAMATSQFLSGVGRKINQHRKTLTRTAYTFMEPLSAGRYKGSTLGSTILYLSEGWWAQEAWGVWSKGKQSGFTIKLSESLLARKSVTLSISGRYLHETEKTGVKINGTDFGTRILRNAKFTVPKELLQHGRLQVQFTHTNPVSPMSLGQSKDTREIKFGLSEVALGHLD